MAAIDSFKTWNPISIIVTALGGTGLVWFLGTKINTAIKKAEGETNKNGTNNPGNWASNNIAQLASSGPGAGTSTVNNDILDPGISISPDLMAENANKFTILDEKGALNGLGRSIANTLDKEIHSTYWVSDAVVVNAIKQLKTQGDYAALQNYWNKIVMPENNDTENLESQMANHLTKGDNTDVMDFINKLPISI